MAMKEIPKKAEHLGIKVSGSKYKLKLVREEYALINKRNSLPKFEGMKKAYADDNGKTYTDEWCLKHQNNCLENYDLHMHLFSLLDHDEFNEEVNDFLISYPMFNQVDDLNELNEKNGYYILILDEYCQVYIRYIEKYIKKNKRTLG